MRSRRGGGINRRIRSPESGEITVDASRPRLPSQAPSARDHLRYRLDRAFASGPIALIFWLAAATFAMVIAAATVLAVLHASINGRAEGSFPEAFWASLLRTLDPGTMGSDRGWEFRLVSLFVTLGGIFIVSTLIGLIATALDRRLERLRHGRSRIIESGHTLILGHSTKLLTVIEELVAANANHRGSCIVVLSPEDKTALEVEIRHRVGNPDHTRIICRTGDGSDPVDLDLVNPLAARSIVILARDDEADDGFVIRSVLALMARRPGLEHLTVVAEMRSVAAARTLRQVTEHRVVTVVSEEIVGRLAAQVCRRHGLSGVYLDLLDFGGSEIYTRDEPLLVGHTFGEALRAFDEAAPIGIARADGATLLAPDLDTRIGHGDQVIVIAEDDDGFVCRGVGSQPDHARPDAFGLRPVPPEPECILFVGWSTLGPIILRELDEYVEAGSQLTIIGDPRTSALPESSEFAGLENIHVATISIDRHDTDRLQEIMLDIAPKHILLLCDRDTLMPPQADAAVLMTLLQIHHILGRLDPGRPRPGIVAELLDHRDVDLAQVTGADDFLVSDRLTSLLMAQLAENPKLDPVFQDLLNVRGAELDLKPITCAPDGASECSFRDLVHLGYETGDVVIGYRPRPDPQDAADRDARVIINPRSSWRTTIRTGDELVVVTQGRH